MFGLAFCNAKCAISGGPLLLAACLLFRPALAQRQQERIAVGQARVAASRAERDAWLENMFLHHRFSVDEAQAVTGLSAKELATAKNQILAGPASFFPRTDDRYHVLAYPGGRHPRIGFLDGAIAPQRETKLSVFAPWDDTSYAVLDFPEAIWSNLGLTYLAHTHVPTVWTAAGVALPQLEWERQGTGFQMVRKLPNGIEFGVKAIPLADHLRLKMWLTNGTENTLTDLRVQNCVMLKGMTGFEQQDNDNKLFIDQYAVAHDASGEHWVISGWEPIHRTWANAQCPCLHADPKFPDCQPGETVWLRGWFSFYQGEDIRAELKRITGSGWQSHPLHHVTGNLVGKVLDAKSRRVIPARLEVESLDSGEHYFATSTAVAGSAIPYDKQLGRTESIERHTTLSADGFQLTVPPGKYRLVATRGKEYLAAEKIVQVSDAATRTSVELPLKRFATMADLGWYSGDTHVHRELNELPNVLMAEDLNVALPLTYWVRDSSGIPAAGGTQREPAPIYLDPEHVIYPINTEYEIFSIEGKRHTQGAVFVLNHTEPFELTAPPVQRVAQLARQQGALLDLDKHSWNWSAMIVPVIDVDLFQLSNNHHWRTQFGFPMWTVDNAPTNWPEIETDSSGGFTEMGWTHFGLQTYYAFLNSGFRMRVTAGTASGVHPVPLGYGRVYVHVDGEFNYEKWIDGLDQGHSFVTQGPLLDIRFNKQLPGTTWNSRKVPNGLTVQGTVSSALPLKTIELVRNGEIALVVEPENDQQSDGSYLNSVELDLQLEGSAWVALRCFQQVAKNSPSGKVVFAHTNPVFVDVENRPLPPRRREVEYFIERIRKELQRNAGVLSATAMAEYREALEIYQRLLPKPK